MYIGSIFHKVYGSAVGKSTILISVQRSQIDGLWLAVGSLIVIIAIGVAFLLFYLNKLHNRRNLHSSLEHQKETLMLKVAIMLGEM